MYKAGKLLGHVAFGAEGVNLKVENKQLSLTRWKYTEVLLKQGTFWRILWMKCILCEQSTGVLSMPKKTKLWTEQFKPMLESDKNVVSVLIL